MCCRLDVRTCDVYHFFLLTDRRVRTRTQTPSLSQSFFTCPFTSFLQPSQNQNPDLTGWSCHDASCEIDHSKHHGWNGKWEPLRLTATRISNSWCVCVCVLKGAIMRRKVYHWRAQIGCQFSYHVIVLAFSVSDDGWITKMFKRIYLV